MRAIYVYTCIYIYIHIMYIFMLRHSKESHVGNATAAL